MPKQKITFKRLLSVLGPGLITGASDDDPSGIATYTQVGAKFGTSLLWTAILTFPLMAAVQRMCARIGIVTTTGLTTTLKDHYPKWILYVMILFSAPAIILNIGADVAAMGAVMHLLIPVVPVAVYTVFFTALLIAMIIWLPYQKIAAILKYLCIVLLIYFVLPFLTKQHWGKIMHDTFIPTFKADKEFISMFVAILGTTISPYLFYWQATMEAEQIKQAMEKSDTTQIIADARLDVNVGMLFSNLVMYFMILTAGTILFKAGMHNIDTVKDAAKALEPLAGKFSYMLFAIGVIGTGLLTIPVLSGTLSYICAETFGWKIGLDKKFWQAKPFYVVIVISMIAGLLINYTGLSPVQALVDTAILYGVTAPVIIAVILHICNNKKIMGQHTNTKTDNGLGIITLLLMTASAIFMLYYSFH
ncbi:MAG: Nramp family divalent metal transporter [Agriterribacter sp.]